MGKRAHGFTLIEIAIVLVIVGLLLSGVVKGQEMISSARVRNLIAQQDGIKAAFFGFEDRYRALSGDYAAASTTINCTPGPCVDGNNNGQIEAPNAYGVQEDILSWSHLSAAGFLTRLRGFAGVGGSKWLKINPWLSKVCTTRPELGRLRAR